jgi:hypothetical protein
VRIAALLAIALVALTVPAYAIFKPKSVSGQLDAARTSSR